MATFNGEAYLGEQVASLLQQTYHDWHLIIRDDGSQDRTPDIIQRYRAQHPDKITFINDGNLNLGARSNFARLLTHAKADYIMLSDQDDVWLPQKISITYDKIKTLETRFGENTPLLVHTDVKVVDSNLQEVAKSLWQYQKSDPEKGTTLRRLLLQNVATGCTVMINKPLRDRALPIPDEAMMHDWWLTLVAAAFGHIGYISEPTLLYRQHERSDIGAKVWNAHTAFRYLRSPAETIRYTNKVNLQVQKQAEVFLERYRDMLNDSDKEMIAIYSQLSKQNCLMKRYYIIEYGFFYTDLLRNIGRLLFA
jgi:glycosyltransferase involved in cell wall biosynthesis